MEQDQVIASTRQWVESFVVEMNLCPFAQRELVNSRVRFSVTEATTEEQLLVALESELMRLSDDSAIETTLLIHPNMLQDFDDYNQFLDYADGLLEQMELEGVFQVASFHPDYQFGGTAPDDAENYSNRAPYPMLHLLREDSLERAIEHYPDAAGIPERNIALMNSVGRDKLHALMQACFPSADK